LSDGSLFGIYSLQQTACEYDVLLRQTAAEMKDIRKMPKATQYA